MTFMFRRFDFRRNRIEAEFTAFNAVYLILLLVAVAASAAIAVAYAGWIGDGAGAAAAGLFLPSLGVAVVPEPAERFTFLAVSVLVSALALLAAVLRWPVLPCRAAEFFFPLNVCIYGVLALMVFWGLSELDFGLSLWANAGAPPGPVLLKLAACAMAAAACLMAGGVWPRRFLLPQGAARGIVLVVFVVAMGLQILSWRIVSEASIEPDGHWSIHADALVYVVYQVSVGKMLLGDLPSQYGFYAEFIGSILKKLVFL